MLRLTRSILYDMNHESAGNIAVTFLNGRHEHKNNFGP